MAKLTKAQRKEQEYQEEMDKRSAFMRSYHIKALDSIAAISNEVQVYYKQMVDQDSCQYYYVIIPEGSLPVHGEQSFRIYRHLNITDEFFWYKAQCVTSFEEFVEAYKMHQTEIKRKQQARQEALNKLTQEEKELLGL